MARKKEPVRRKGYTVPGELTIRAIAEGIGVSTTIIERNVRAGCPRTSIEAVKKWRAQNVKTASASAMDHSELTIELKRAELCERLENARGRKIRNDATDEKLIQADEVARDTNQGLAIIEAGLSDLGARCASRCPPELQTAVEELIDSKARLCLRELRDGLAPYLANTRPLTFEQKKAVLRGHIERIGRQKK